MNAQTAAIRKFNPGTLQSDEDVIRQFVVRQGELQIVLRTLADNVDAACCQHLLLIAPRGRGKTMMLARVAAEMRTNGEFTSDYLPIRFMEESQEIFSVADFWLETLFHLAKAVEKHDMELAAELAKAHADFATRWQERDIAEHVRTTVLSAAQRMGKKLLLMVENLQSLSDSVDDDFGWQLRETLQCEPRIVLLATAASRFAALDNANEAFFELFRTINLEPLDTESCSRLWQAVTGDGLSDREIRPLQILTGGSPRFLVIMGEFSRHRSMRELLEELVTLIDDHTEYFRGYSEVLAKQERRVYLALADLWQPYCIYYKLRREPDEAAVVHSLIRFMTAFYSGPEFASNDSPELTKLAAEALFNKGVTLGKLGREDDEIAAYDEIVRRFGSSDAPNLQETIATALILKALAAIQAGNPDIVLTICDDIECRISPPNPNAIRSMWLRANALVLLGQHAKAMRALKAAYEALDPSDSKLIPISSYCISTFVAAGADEKRMLQIPTNDDGKAKLLLPLIVVLRCRMGEDVQAPAEVHEVANDLMHYIDGISNGGSGAPAVDR